MTGATGLLLIVIGMIAGLGVILWLFTHDVGQCKIDHSPYVDAHQELEDLDSLLPPDEIFERHVMHQDRWIR